MNYILRREDGGTFLVDCDLWLGALDLAVRNGWKPRGVEVPGKPRTTSDRLHYADGGGLRIRADDAGELARGLRAALPSIPDELVPMGKPFDETTTQDLIRRASAGDAIEAEELPGAAEVLSGPPKDTARMLADFLARGSLTVHTA